MKQAFQLCVCIGLAVVVTGCGQVAGGCRARLAGLPAKASWTPEEIAANPEGYLVYAGSVVDQQIAQRESSLALLAQRKIEIEQKANAFQGKLRNLENLYGRLATACRKADDEDRWPVKVGGKTFDKDTAAATLDATKAYVEERRPLAGAYTDAMQRLAATEAATRTDLIKLGNLKDKVAVDLERVRLNKGMAEMAELRQTEEALASFSGVVADTTQDPTAGIALPGNEGPKNVNVEELLK